MLALDKPLDSILLEDMRTLANSLGIADAIESGNQVCAFCSDAVTDFSEIFAVFPLNSESVGVVNRRPACIRAFTVYVQRAGVI